MHADTNLCPHRNLLQTECTTSNVQAENLKTEEIRHNSIPAISENLLQTFPRALYSLLLKFYIFQPESQNLLQVPTFCKTLFQVQRDRPNARLKECESSAFHRTSTFLFPHQTGFHFHILQFPKYCICQNRCSSSPPGL